MPIVPRELTITYGAFQVGGDSDTYRLDAGDDGTDLLRITREYERTFVEFGVLVADESWTDAVFAANVAALEVAFRDVRVRLLIQQGPFPGGPLETILDLDPATDTGIDVSAVAEKTGEPHDSGRSRRYRVRVSSGNPADQTVVFAGEAGLQLFAHTRRFQPSRVQALDVSGTYTKLGVNSATVQYLGQIDARVAALTTAFGGDWEIVDENRDPNLEDSLIRFSRTYEQLQLRQTLALIDDPTLSRQRLVVNVGRTAPGDTGGDVLRLTEVSITYEVWLDAVAFPNVQTMRAKWDSELRPWILSHARDAAGISSLAIVDERVNYNAVSNAINAQIQALGAGNGGVLSRTITTEDTDRKGLRFVPVWNSDPLSAYTFQGPREVLRAITGVERRLGTVGATDFGAADPGGGVAFLGGFGIGDDLIFQAGGGGGGGGPRRANRGFLGGFGIGDQLVFDSGGPEDAAQEDPTALGPPPGQLAFVLVEERMSTTPLTLGLPPDQIKVTDITHVRITRLVRGVALPGGGGGAGGGGGGGTRVAAQGFRE